MVMYELWANRMQHIQARQVDILTFDKLGWCESIVKNTFNLGIDQWTHGQVVMHELRANRMEHIYAHAKSSEHIKHVWEYGQ